MASSRDHIVLRGVGLASLDSLCIFMAYLAGLVVTSPDSESFRLYFIGQLEYLFVFVVIWCFQAFDRKLFVSRRGDAFLPQLFSFTRTLLLSLVMSIFILALWNKHPLEREFTIAFAGFMLLIMVIFRTTIRLGVLGLRRRGYAYRRILLVGANSRAANIASIIQSRRHYGFQIVGYLDDDPERCTHLDPYDLQYEGPIEKLEEYLLENVVDVVYIALPVGSQYERIRNIAYLCEGVGVPVRMLADLFPTRLAKSALLKVGDIPMLSMSMRESDQGRMLIRRVSDFFVSLLLLAILSPLLFIIAALISLRLGGAVLSKNLRKRPSDGKEFTMLRFRTEDAETGETTRFVGAIRRYGLDELPALFNILKGEMSIEDLRFPLPSHDPESEEPAVSTESKGAPSPAAVRTRIRTFAIDCVGILLAYAVSVFVSYHGSSVYWDMMIAQMPYLAIFIIFWWVTTNDDRRVGVWLSDQMSTHLGLVTKALADALVMSTVVMALFTVQGVGRNFLVVFGCGIFLVIFALRVIGSASEWGLRHRDSRSMKVLIIGANERTRRLIETLLKRTGRGVSIVGVLEDDPERAAQLDDLGVSHLGSTEEFERCMNENDIDEVFVTLPIRSFYGTVRNVASVCEECRVPLRMLADLFPLRIARNHLMYISDVPLVSLSPVPEERVRLGIKRAIDFFASTLLLAGLFLPLSIVAIIIKLDSRGPIFFGQERVGQNQRRFKMLKFRSMVVDAEARQSEISHLNEADGPVFKIRNDPRITRVGAFIRKYSIDEFPQLINVWVGQMSLVGPRPPLMNEVVNYTWAQRRRLSVKPGMTGLWQVSGRSDVDFEEWVELDLKYIDTWSILKDFSILLRTFRAVFEGRGAA